MWVPLAVATAALFAMSGSYAKALSRNAHVYVVTWAMMSASLPVLLALVGVRGVPEIGPGFLKAALISVGLNMVAVTIQVKALSISPLSLTVPFLAFTPLFMLVTSAFILHEAPDAKGLLGILLIVSGAYSINLDKLAGGVLAPFKAIVSEPGSRLMLLVSLLWSVTAAYDKVAVVESSPLFYATFFATAFGLLYAPLLAFGLRRTNLAGSLSLRLLLLGAIAAAMILCQLTAIELTVASYVIAIKRAGMVLSVVLGYFFFKERKLRIRLVGAALMTAGVVTLSL